MGIDLGLEVGYSMQRKCPGHVPGARRANIPPGSDTGRSWFLLSSGCDGSRYYGVAHGTRLIPNEIQFPCRTLVACLAIKHTAQSVGDRM